MQDSLAEGLKLTEGSEISRLDYVVLADMAIVHVKEKAGEFGKELSDSDVEAVMNLAVYLA